MVRRGSCANQVGVFLEKSQVDGGNGGHAGGRGQSSVALFQCGQGFFQGQDGRIAQPGINKPLFFAGEKSRSLFGAFKGES